MKRLLFISILFFTSLKGISQHSDLCYHGAYSSGSDSIRFAFLFYKIESVNFDYKIVAYYYAETKTPILFEENYFCKTTAAGFYLCADSTKVDEFKIHGNFGGDKDVTITNPQFLHYPANQTSVKMEFCDLTGLSENNDERIVDATEYHEGEGIAEEIAYDDGEIVESDEVVEYRAPIIVEYTTEESSISDEAVPPDEVIAINEPVGADDVYTISEVEPSFPGGMDEMYIFLSKNLVYPQTAVDAGIQGKVFVQFIVEKDGTITGVKVVRGVSPELDKEAVRVISSMPTWIPGTQNGKAVRVRYTLPVNFKL